MFPKHTFHEHVKTVSLEAPNGLFSMTSYKEVKMIIKEDIRNN